MKIINLTIRGCTRCPHDNNREMVAGDPVRMTIDTSIVVGMPAEIIGTVATPPVPTSIVVLDETTGQHVTVAARYYEIEYDESVLPAALTELRKCDVLEIECLNCCDVLEERVEALEGRVTALEAVTNSQAVEIFNLGARVQTLEFDYSTLAARVTALETP